MAGEKLPPSPKKVDYEKLEAMVKELDRIAKLLVRRDLELLETRERLEQSLVELEKKNTELNNKIKDLKRFERLTVGRELRMIELKKEIKELKRRLAEKEQNIMPLTKDKYFSQV